MEAWFLSNPVIYTLVVNYRRRDNYNYISKITWFTISFFSTLRDYKHFVCKDVLKISKSTR